MPTSARKDTEHKTMSLEKGGRRNRILFNMTLLTLSLCLSVVITEMALHAIFVSHSGTSFQYRIPHPVFGWVLEPNASYTNRLAEAAVPVTYNSRGWRDVEHQVENPDDVFRILILGDSFMEAYSVALEESFPRQLEALVRASGVDAAERRSSGPAGRPRVTHVARSQECRDT